MIKKLSYPKLIALFSLLLWTALFFLQFIKKQETNNISYFEARIEFIIHIVMLFFIGKIYTRTHLENKAILLWLLISVIGLFLNDISFYYVIYFPSNYIARVSSLHFLITISPFFIWAIAIIIFFYKILILTFQLKDFYKIIFVFTILNTIIIFLCFSSIPYATNISRWQSTIQLIGYATESIIFDLAILCLIYSKNKGLSWIASGFAILVSGDFLLTYNHLTQTDNTFGMHGELFWFLGLLFMAFGIFDLKSIINYPINWIKKKHSIKHVFAFWNFRLSFFSILPSFILVYFFLPINNAIFLLLPPLLIGYSIILVTFSLLIGRHFETPFKQLENNIDALILNKDKTKVNANFSTEEFIFLQNFIVDAFKIKEQKELVQQAMLNLAAQVAHDIRSPLAAINTALSDVTSVPENKRIMIRNAANRINDIANNLLSQAKNNFDTQESNADNRDSPELIFVVLDNIVAEKRYEYYGTNVSIKLNGSDSSYNCFSNIHLSSFKRVLSNLINNSIEAVNSDGSIVISLTCNATHVEIIVEDNGCGIPSEILPKIRDQGFSFNKKNGAGIGLSYTNHYLEQIKGKMLIQSEEKIGTRITIELLRSEHPSWFCDRINILQGSIIVVLDDDPSIHEVWDEKFASITNIKIFHCYNLSELVQLKTEPLLPILYLIDYELISDIKNGLEVIEELRLNNKAILVTSCFEDIAVRSHCENIGVKIIPKSYVPYIKIIKMPYTEHSSSLVFIDDDETMRMTWSFAAEEAGKSISTYSSFDEFLKKISNYNKDTIIYIDSDLGNNIKGELCAKHLFDEGFIEIHLATGHPKDHFSHMPWIKSIVGKTPPF